MIFALPLFGLPYSPPLFDGGGDDDGEPDDPVVPSLMRDITALEDLAKRIEAKGLFDDVIRAQDATEAIRGHPNACLAIISHKSAVEREIACNPVTYRRVVDYEVTISIASTAERRAEGEETIERLAAIVGECAAGFPGIGGFTHPGESNLGNLRYERKGAYPTQRATMTGQFVYLVVPGRRYTDETLEG